MIQPPEWNEPDWRDVPALQWVKLVLAAATFLICCATAAYLIGKAGGL